MRKSPRSKHVASIADATGSSPGPALPRSRQGMSLSWGWKRCTGRDCPYQESLPAPRVTMLS